MDVKLLESRPVHTGLLVTTFLIAIIFVMTVGLVQNGNSKFDSVRFKEHVDETRLEMYADLKSMNLKGSSKEEILKLLGEPLLGITESNKWIYPMGSENEVPMDLVVTFRDGKVKKLTKARKQDIDE